MKTTLQDSHIVDKGNKQSRAALSKMQFSLYPALEADIPILAEIAHAACLTDRHTRLKADYGDYNHGQTMSEALTMWLARPTTQCHVIKAINDSTHEIIGWIVWGFKGYDDENNTTATSTTDKAPSDSNNNSEINPDSQTQSSTPSRPPQSLTQLSTLTNQTMQHHSSQLSPLGIKSTYIISLSISPKAQHRGVGTTLVKYGTDIADRDGVHSWVSSSHDGVQFFRKMGFEVEVGRLDVDLDEVARGEREKGQGKREAEVKYGVYTFWYLKRLPVPLRQ